MDIAEERGMNLNGRYARKERAERKRGNVKFIILLFCGSLKTYMSATM